MTFHPFDPPRPIAQYLGQPGAEPNGLLLSWEALDAYAASVSTRQPPELVVVGYDEPVHLCRDRGRHRCAEPCPEIGTVIGPKRLRLAANREHIEATTSFRHREGRLRYECRSCNQLDGQHLKGCVLA